MTFAPGDKKLLEFKICSPLIGKNIPLPSYSSDGSAGLDLRACICEKELALQPGETRLIPTGIAIHLKEPHYAALILPRSGLGHRHGIVLGNLVGLIDSDYQKELMVSLWNRSQNTYHLLPGERIAQLVVIPVQLVELIQVREFDQIDTPHGGFGTSGRI